MDMQEHWFENLLRSMATGASRRSVLRKLGAGAAGGFLALAGISTAAADPPGCKRGGKRCNDNSQCCSEVCSAGFCLGADCEPCRHDSDCMSGNCEPLYGLCLPEGWNPLLPPFCSIR
jgi:hypothetical protein